MLPIGIGIGIDDTFEANMAVSVSNISNTFEE